MFKLEWVTIILIVFGAMLGAVFGFWTTVALISCLIILWCAKQHWKDRPKVESTAEAEPQTA